MAIINLSNQYKYTGKGPFDAKSLVKTYSDLTNTATWTVDGSIVAYNGMIVAVWLDKTDVANNGIYYLFDSSVTSTRQAPDVTNAANWHKISDKVDLSSIEESIENLESRVSALEEEDKLHTYGYRKDFPKEGGIEGHIYVAVDEKKTYVWFDNVYTVVGRDYEEPTIIFGGDAGI